MRLFVKRNSSIGSHHFVKGEHDVPNNIAIQLINAGRATAPDGLIDVAPVKKKKKAKKKEEVVEAVVEETPEVEEEVKEEK